MKWRGVVGSVSGDGGGGGGGGGMQLRLNWNVRSRAVGIWRRPRF